MKNKKLERVLLRIFATKLGWLGISIFFIILFNILSNIYDWAYIAMLVSMIYPIGLALVFIVYAWIINPIKSLQNKK